MDKYQEEREEAKRWANKEESLVTERLRKTGRLLPGLDANVEEYRYIYDELERRRKDIQTRAKH